MKRELDCRGLQCPEPVARCRACLAESRPDILNVLVDNAAALENVSRYLERNGYATVTTQLSSQEWQIGAANTGKNPGEPTDKAESHEEKILILLTTETLGRGDDTLGAKLMETFLANLPELGPSLWRIILLNGAVKLSARDGEALKSLQALELGGVGVYVCGTCLMHYGLMEQKQVGQTTNMMDIITSMSLAQKIIRP